MQNITLCIGTWRNVRSFARHRQLLERRIPLLRRTLLHHRAI